MAVSIDDQQYSSLAERLSEGQTANRKVTFLGSKPFGEVLRVVQFGFGNGLKVLLVEDPVAPVVAFHTWYRVGSRHEHPGKTGIAHLFEHLMFTETEQLKPGQFDLEMEALGADSNAATWMDWTQYHVAVPREALGRVIELEAERMGHLTLSQPLLDSEKEVVANERRYTVEDDVEGAIGELLWATAFQKHPYRWPTIGWMSDIHDFTLSDCQAFYRTHYSPNNAALVVVGDLKCGAVLRLLQDHYGEYNAAKLPSAQSVVEPEQQKERRVEIKKLTPTHKLSIGYRAPGMAHADHWLLTVVCELLFGGRSSRIVRRLVTELEVASDLRGSVAPLRDAGLLEVFINARPGKTAQENLDCLDVEIKKVIMSGVTEDELSRACARIELGFLSRLDTADGKASTLGFHEVVQEQPTAGFLRMAELQSIRPEDARRVMQQYMAPRSRSVILVSPNGKSREAA